MNIPEFSVRRPITILMIIITICALGLVAFRNLKLDFMPDIKFPMIVVATPYPGAGPEEIENFVSKPIEEAVGTAKGIKSIKSFSQDNISVVLAEFEWGQDMDAASFEIREKIDPVLEDLPDGCHRPFLIKADATTMMPTAILGFYGPQDLRQLKKFADDVLKRELEKVDGVAAVTVMGGLEREIRVELDIEKLRAYNIPVSQIEQILKAENVNVPGGEITEGLSEFRVRTMGEFSSVDEIKNIAIGMSGGSGISLSSIQKMLTSPQSMANMPAPKPILLKDVAEVKDSFKEVKQFSRLQGENVITLIVTKESVANTVDVSDALKKALKKIKKEIPSGSQIIMVYDQAKFIRSSISNISSSAIFGGILAVIVVFTFIYSGASTLIIAFSIPFSFIATFVLMYFGNMTLNLITLGGLTLAVGRFVDNSIVVLENNYRFLELGTSPKEAAIKGASEVLGAVFASTLTGVAVFFPIILVTGMVKYIFSPMTWTVVFALFSSLFVSVTFVPMISSRILKNPIKISERNKIIFAWEKVIKGLSLVYRKAIKWCLLNKFHIVFLAILILMVTVFLFSILGLEFFPKMDTGQIMIEVETPIGTSVTQTEKIVKELEDFVSKIPEVNLVMVRGGGSGEESSGIMQLRSGGNTANSGVIQIDLKDRKYRKRTTDQIKDIIREKFKTIPGATFKFTEMFGQMSEAPVVITVRGNDLNVLTKLGEEIAEKIKVVKGVYDVDLNWRPGNPEYQIKVDRTKAGHLGLVVGQIAMAVRSLIKGNEVSKFRERGEEYDITIIARKEDRDWVKNIENIVIQSPLGSQIPLRELAQIKLAKGPSEISRDNHWRSIKVLGDKSKRPLGDIIKDIDKIIKTISVPEGYVIEYGGEEEDRREAFGGLFIAMIMAVFLLYMILAAQFESLMQPFIVMLTIPLELIGVAVALLITGKPLDIMAMLGILTVTGNVLGISIVMITYINQLREEGMDRDTAVIEGASIRLRPILMTTFTTVFGVLPLALGIGEGAEMWQALALAMFGGLVSALFLTLFIIPVAYVVLDDLVKVFRKNVA